MQPVHNTDLAEKFLEIIPKAMRSIRTEMRKAAQSELNVTQFRVMANLSRHPANNGDLAEIIGVSIPAMSRLIDGIVKSGFVKRTYGKSDRRKVQLQLTEKGETVYRNLRKVAQAQFVEGFATLTTEQKNKLSEGLKILEEVYEAGAI